MTGAELATELEATLRTVYRDLGALHEAGFPIYSEKNARFSYWKLLDTFKRDFPLPLTVTELMALHISRDLLGIFEGTVFHESIETLFNKVKAILLPETVRYLENISARLKVGFTARKDLAAFKEVIRQVSEATAKRKRVEIAYKAVSTGRETQREIDPYQVWAMNGGFYLIGLCHLRNSVRTFAMDRIKRLKVLDQSFSFPKEFSLEDYLQTAFHVMRGEPERITVRFAPGVAHVVRERIWHPTQEIRELADGGAEISLEVPINYEIVSWILGFGATARVLEPDSLRSRIQDELRVAAAQYKDPLLTNEAFTKKIMLD
jgi:proteasome accessory factor B